MIDDSAKSSNDDALDHVVAHAATLLRRSEPVSPQWRAELLARVETPRPRRAAMRTWIPIGLAAAVCIGLGVARFAARGQNDRVRFSISAPAAARVSLVGDFDGWNPDALPMRRAGADTWTVDVRLEPGRHVFAFSVDGGLRSDPAAPRAVEDDFGVPSSVVVVPGKGTD
jgi:hypothetical protein